MGLHMSKSSPANNPVLRNTHIGQHLSDHAVVGGLRPVRVLERGRVKCRRHVGDAAVLQELLEDVVELVGTHPVQQVRQVGWGK